MTFVKVQDPTNKNLVKEYLARRNRVREADRKEKMGQAFEFEELSRFFKPVTAQTQELTKQVGELPGKIARAMPKPQIREEAPPPAYDALPFASEDTFQPETEDLTRNLPPEVVFENKGYKIGALPLLIDHKNKNIVLNTPGFSPKSIQSDRIYELLTNQSTNVRWKDLNEGKKRVYGLLLIESGVMEDKTDPTELNKAVFSKRGGKWNGLYSYVWYNKWLFKDDFKEKERDEMRKLKKAPSRFNPKTTEEAKNKVNQLASEKTGKGVKTDYVTLPSDPNELVERLELLLASRDASNTGVHNEIVSICEELRKRKMLTRAQYKQLLSD